MGAGRCEVSAHRVRPRLTRSQDRVRGVQPGYASTSGSGMSSHDTPNLTKPATGSGVQELLRVLPAATDEAPKVGPG